MENEQGTNSFSNGLAAQQLSSSSQTHLLPLLLDNVKEPDFLFHYTSPGGLCGILRSRSVWASDVRFLNDAKEAMYTMDLVRSRITLKSSDLPSDLERRWLRALKIAEETRAYVSCFSRRGDSLSQWRAYARAGYAIGISAEALLEIAKAQPVRTLLLPCKYDHNEHIRIVDWMLDRLVDAHGAALRDGQMEAVSLHAHEVALYGSVVLLSASFKHPSFAEEHEWRLVQIPQDPEVADDGLQVRDSGRWLVPYRTIPLTQAESPLALRQIVIGPSPHPELAKAAAEVLVSEVCMRTPSQSSPTASSDTTRNGSNGERRVVCEEFRLSQIPYRDW
jgi:hypothetical protein